MDLVDTAENKAIEASVKVTNTCPSCVLGSRITIQSLSSPSCSLLQVAGGSLQDFLEKRLNGNQKSAIHQLAQGLGSLYRENSDTGDVHDASVKGSTIPEKGLHLVWSPLITLIYHETWQHMVHGMCYVSVPLETLCHGDFCIIIHRTNA